MAITNKALSIIIAAALAALAGCSADTDADTQNTVPAAYDTAEALPAKEQTTESSTDWDSIPEADASDFDYFAEGYQVEIDNEVKGINTNVIIRKYLGDRQKVKIPAFIDGLPVTQLAYVFRDNADVTAVFIPEGVEGLFNIPGTFMNCTSLREVYIPGTCSDLNSVIFPEVFEGCNSLSEIVISEDNPRYFSQDGIVYVRSGLIGSLDDGISALYCPRAVKQVFLPEDTRWIREFAFQDCDSITEIKLPAYVKKIGAYAFENCDKLKSVTIPEGVESIGKYAFANCPELKKITLPSTITEIEGILSDGELVVNYNGSAYTGADGMEALLQAVRENADAS